MNMNHSKAVIVIKQKKEKIGRNDLCFCGSGKKYKKCCIKKVKDKSVKSNSCFCC